MKMSAVRIRCIAVSAVAWLVTSGVAVAQESPYSSMTEREIKALSPEQIEGYQAGQGMGFALAGELNGYPGPKHVLELRQELGLSIQQRSEMQEIFDRMQDRAVELGQQIVALEGQLDHRFSAGDIDEGRLAGLTEEIGRLNGRLRGVHLRAHLEATRVLSPHQRTKYAALRGYDDGVHRGHH